MIGAGFFVGLVGGGARDVVDGGATEVVGEFAVVGGTAVVGVAGAEDVVGLTERDVAGPPSPEVNTAA